MATKGKVKVSIPVTEFMEDGLYYLYTPALDIYGYGRSEEAANESFEVSLKLFFEHTIENGTLAKALTKLGWKLQKKKSLPVYKTPDFLDSLKHTEMYETLNAVDYKKFLKPITIPVVN